MASNVTFAKTGNRLIALANDPIARGILYEMQKEDVEFSSMQLMELDSLHQVGYVPVDLGEYNQGDTVPLWVAPTEEVTISSIITAPPATSSMPAHCTGAPGPYTAPWSRLCDIAS